MKLNILIVVLFALLLKESTSATTINVPNNVPLSNYNTLTSNVLYTVNMTFSPITIPAGSVFLMQFSIHFTIDNTSLNNCQYSLAGEAYSSAACSVAFNTQNNQYEVSFTNIYPSNLTNQSSLNLLVLLILFSLVSPILKWQRHKASIHISYQAEAV